MFLESKRDLTPPTVYNPLTHRGILQEPTESEYTSPRLADYHSLDLDHAF